MKLFITLCVSLFAATNAADYSMIGFATLNGGTTGGAGGKTVQPKTVAEFVTYAKSKDTLIIEVNGTLSAAPDGIAVNVASNKTIIGIGSTAFLDGVGLHVSKAHNVIIRNLKMTMSNVNLTHKNDEGRQQVTANDGDTIGIDTSYNVWVDHNEFYSIDPAKNSNFDLFDGFLDIKKDSHHITVSYNYFHDHWKVSLVGSSDSDNYDRRITYHHNYFKNVDERLPSYRFGTGHIFNNYYDHVLTSGINNRMGSCLKIENNYFEKSKDPIAFLYSKQAGGVQVSGNVFVDTIGLEMKTSNCTQTIPYEYELEDAETAKQTVLKNVGVGKF